MTETDMINTLDKPSRSSLDRVVSSHALGLEPRADGANQGSPEIVIEPRSGWIAIDWREMYTQRELLFFLVWRDIQVRYKQTVLGSAWAVIQPLMLMLIFSFLGRFARIEHGSAPFPLFVFAGLIPWTLFSQGFPQAALSLVNQQNMLSKVYFPRLFVPVACACVFLVDLLYSLVIYGFLLLAYGYTPAWTVIFVPFLVVLTLIATLSLGITLAALTVFYRDFRHLVPFMVQILMYVIPVFYPAWLIPEKYHSVLALNPMFGIVTAYRSAILGYPWDFQCLLISSVSAVLTFVFAIFYFRRTERAFADFA